MMKQLVGLVLVTCLLVLTACGGRYIVPAQQDIPNPAIGGRVFGPRPFPSCDQAQALRDAERLEDAQALQIQCLEELRKAGVGP